MAGAASWTSWPSEASSVAASRTAATASGCTGVPSGEAVVKPMRRRPGACRIASAQGCAGGAIAKASPGSAPAIASSARAVSRTLREITPSLDAPNQASPRPGPHETRPRDGRSPNRPQQAAGMRIEPPPSAAAAMGTMPDAIAAAAPPLDPPGTWSTFHGLLVRPLACESVTAFSANSGRLVLPNTTRPASR